MLSMGRQAKSQEHCGPRQPTALHSTAQRSAGTYLLRQRQQPERSLGCPAPAARSGLRQLPRCQPLQPSEVQRRLGGCERPAAVGEGSMGGITLLYTRRA